MIPPRFQRRILIVALVTACASAYVVWMAFRVPSLPPPADALPPEVSRDTRAFDTRILAIADADKDGKISDTEALLLTLRAAEALEQPYDDVRELDIDTDGKVDDNDLTIMLSAMENLDS